MNLFFSFLNCVSSPLEQFQILPIFPLRVSNAIDFSVTNQTIILVIVIVLFVSLIYSLLENNNFFIVPTEFQVVLEFIYEGILSLVTDNLKGEKNQIFFPIVFSLFMFHLTLNVSGLVPYAFTVTSHLIVTFSIALAMFIGINIVGLRKNKFKFFSLFLPPGTGIGFAFLLVPIEFISYIFKPVSLSVRLFANMMAGHTLLKVIAGFAFILMSKSGFLFLMHYIPLMVLVPLFFLELGVAIIQAFVFSILISIYLNDVINLH